jgi:hypothetical protein
VLRIEALALAIARENDCLNPGSEAFATMNPGMIRAYSLDRLLVVNENAVRVFDTFEAGLRALMSNLKVKCYGKTRANGDQGRLGPDSTLRELLKSYRIGGMTANANGLTRNVVEYLIDALDDRAINENTPLRFFIES